MSDRDHFVYWVYNSAGEVIYVGCTRSPQRRWRAHKNLKPDMVHQTHSCHMAGPYEYATARRIEAHQIHAQQPDFNSYGTGFIHCPCGCQEDVA